MVRLGVDAVISFSIVPLRIVLSLGLFASLVAVLVGVSTLVARLAGGYTVPGWTTVVLVTTFLGGMQLIVLGLMGEYVGRIYDEVKQRPLYLVSRTVGIHRSGVGVSLPRSPSLGGRSTEPGEPQQGGRLPPESAKR
jgi:dolichol-phosphate mannosyltransferase